MKLVLQIAVGVVLGGLVVLAIAFGPSWLREYRIRAEAEQELRAITPEGLMARCGETWMNQKGSTTDRGPYWDLGFHSEDGRLLIVGFEKVNGAWRVHQVLIGSQILNQKGKWVDGMVLITDPMLLPCARP